MKSLCAPRWIKHRQEIFSQGLDGGGVKKEDITVGIFMLGILGIVAGNGGNVIFGIVGMLGKVVGIVGNVGKGVVVGNGGNATGCGSVGIVGNGGNCDGIVGSVGIAEVCSKLRAAKLTFMLESDTKIVRARAKICLNEAIK